MNGRLEDVQETERWEREKQDTARREFLVSKGYVFLGDVGQKPVFENGPFWNDVTVIHSDYLKWVKATHPQMEPAKLDEYTLRVRAPFNEVELIDPFGRHRGRMKIDWSAAT